MRFKSIARSMAVVLLVMLALQVAAPLGLMAQQKTCQQAFDNCCAVAAVVGPLYYVFCIEGYVFCLRFVKQ